MYDIDVSNWRFTLRTPNTRSFQKNVENFLRRFDWWWWGGGFVFTCYRYGDALVVFLLVENLEWIFVFRILLIDARGFYLYMKGFFGMFAYRYTPTPLFLNISDYMRVDSFIWYK